MRTSLRTIVAWFLFSASIAASAQANPASDARRSVQAAYEKNQMAFNRGDSKAVLEQMTSDYHLINIQGQKLSRSDMGRLMTLWFSASKTLEVKFVIKRIQIRNGNATVVFAEHARASGVNPQTKKLSKLVSDSLAEETWVKIDGRWLKRRTKTLRMRLVVDGKLQPL